MRKLSSIIEKTKNILHKYKEPPPSSDFFGQILTHTHMIFGLYFIPPCQLCYEYGPLAECSKGKIVLRSCLRGVSSSIVQITVSNPDQLRRGRLYLVLAFRYCSYTMVTGRSFKINGCTALREALISATKDVFHFNSVVTFHEDQRDTIRSTWFGLWLGKCYLVWRKLSRDAYLCYGGVECRLRLHQEPSLGLGGRRQLRRASPWEFSMCSRRRWWELGQSVHIVGWFSPGHDAFWANRSL